MPSVSWGTGQDPGTRRSGCPGVRAAALASEALTRWLGPPSALSPEHSGGGTHPWRWVALSPFWGTQTPVMGETWRVRLGRGRPGAGPRHGVCRLMGLGLWHGWARREVCGGVLGWTRRGGGRGRPRASGVEATGHGGGVSVGLEVPSPAVPCTDVRPRRAVGARTQLASFRRPPRSACIIHRPAGRSGIICLLKGGFVIC